MQLHNNNDGRANLKITKFKFSSLLGEHSLPLSGNNPGIFLQFQKSYLQIRTATLS